MKEKIDSPFYSIKNDHLLYLEKCKVCKLPKDNDVKNKILDDEGAILYKSTEPKYLKKGEILVLEPHPDDFVLSALGYASNTERVTVLNIFSKMILDSFKWKEHIKISNEEYEKIRIKESELAIEKLLKYKFISLKEKSMRITKKTQSEVENIILKDVLEILKKNNNIDTLMIPMGIGNHPDHIIVNNSILNRFIKNDISKKIKIILYPEYPYARCKMDYFDKLEFYNKKYNIKTHIVNVEDKLDDIANAIAAYRCQFNSLNKRQILALIREDSRVIAKEYNQEKPSLVYYEILK